MNLKTFQTEHLSAAVKSCVLTFYKYSYGKQINTVHKTSQNEQHKKLSGASVWTSWACTRVKQYFEEAQRSTVCPSVGGTQVRTVRLAVNLCFFSLLPCLCNRNESHCKLNKVTHLCIWRVDKYSYHIPTMTLSVVHFLLSQAIARPLRVVTVVTGPLQPKTPPVLGWWIGQ